MNFRNFIRRPTANETYGFALRGETSELLRRHQLAGLAKRLSIAHRWNDERTAGIEIWENSNIPSGYTYLGQLVAHDCVHSSIPTGALPDTNNGIRSRRDSLLRLDTVYGGGPDASPAAYVPEDARSPMRNRLLLSRATSSDLNSNTNVVPFRDIGRAKPHLSNATSERGYSAALIPDPRNDVHAVSSQVAMLFHLLHNRVLAQLERELGDVAFPSEDIKRYRLYFAARLLCEDTYRLIVRDDFLPRILHPSVLNRYGRREPDYLDSQSLDELPIEFAHVFRFGHAMVRPFYVINGLKPDGEELVDMLLTTSGFRPWRMPVDESWLVQWSHFFAIGGSKPNLSRRIGPDISAGLYSGQAFCPVDDTGSVGLVYRDLLSSAHLSLWSVPALAREIFRRNPDLCGLSPLLVDESRRQGQLEDWLTRHRDASGLTDGDIESLSRDPPLFFYTLFEAAHDGQGRHLGIMGSIVMAEVLYKALGAWTHMKPFLDHAYSFEHLAKTAFGRADLAPRLKRCAPRLETMPDLIVYLGSDGTVDEARVPFI